MRVVIVGAGEVGFNAARMLSHEGHRVVVVDQDETLVEQAGQRLDALVMHGNGASPKVLRKAGIENSELLVAVTSTDEVNIVACLAAKAQGVERTVARRSEEHTSELQSRQYLVCRLLLEKKK